MPFETVLVKLAQLRLALIVLAEVALARRNGETSAIRAFAEADRSSAAPSPMQYAHVSRRP